MSIQIQNLSYTEADEQLLYDITVPLTNGHLVILGANGSGKTMLSRIISGNLTPSSGSIHIDNKAFQTAELWELKKHIGIVSPKLFEDYDDDDTVIDIVCSGLFGAIGVMHHKGQKNLEVVKKFIQKISSEKHPDAKSKAQKLLKKVGIEHLSEFSIHRLSYGEQMRVLIARALMIDPKLLIFDEPTSGLDIKGKATFRNILKELEKESQIIYITHHIEELLPNMKTVLLMKEGKVFAYGEISELLTSETLSECLDCALTVTEKDGRYSIAYD